MMLLAAIVLLIAFVSMAIMISRVSLVASETSRDQHGPFLREAAAVSTAVEIIQAEAPTDYAAYLGLVQDLQAYEAQRGFLLSWECSDGASALDYFRLTDGRSTSVIPVLGPVEGNDDCSATS